MEKELMVTGENGETFKVNVIDIFMVDEYPEKEYIAYTFNEPEDAEDFKAYVSILKETENDYTLVGISDPEEWKIVQESFNNLLTEEDEN